MRKTTTSVKLLVVFVFAVLVGLIVLASNAQAQEGEIAKMEGGLLCSSNGEALIQKFRTQVLPNGEKFADEFSGVYQIGPHAGAKMTILRFNGGTFVQFATKAAKQDLQLTCTVGGGNIEWIDPTARDKAKYF